MATYDELKTFEGRKYTGMKVGGRHKWYYDEGEWRERKVAPDRWEISYAVNKRRAGRAPPGSGVPVGTEYHWYILAHQNVRKVDENTYTTALSGMKYTLSHKRAGSEKWASSEAAQRRNLVKILKEMIAELEKPEAAAPPNGSPRRRAPAPPRAPAAVKSRPSMRAHPPVSRARRTRSGRAAAS